MKSVTGRMIFSHLDVTLRVRVWIEIDLQVVVPCGKCVTLRVRVWIEIDLQVVVPCGKCSHPPCEGVD